jgi:hypothetical protein
MPVTNSQLRLIKSNQMSVIAAAEQPLDIAVLKYAIEEMKGFAEQGKWDLAMQVGKNAFDKAIDGLDVVPDELYREVTEYLQVIRDSLVLYSQKSGNSAN